MWTQLFSWAKNINYSEPYLTVDLDLFNNSTATYQNAWQPTALYKARKSSCKQWLLPYNNAVMKQRGNSEKPAPLPLSFRPLPEKKKPVFLLCQSILPSILQQKEMGCLQLTLPDVHKPKLWAFFFLPARFSSVKVLLYSFNQFHRTWLCTAYHHDPSNSKIVIQTYLVPGAG